MWWGRGRIPQAVPQQMSYTLFCYSITFQPATFSPCRGDNDESADNTDLGSETGDQTLISGDGVSILVAGFDVMSYELIS
jgi:hypothetical protein